MNIKQLKATFENDDVLILKLALLSFPNYQPVTLWILSYGKQCEYPLASNYDMVGDEYFPASRSDTAKQAFNKRLSSSNPKHESDMGYAIKDLLITKSS